MCINIKIFLKNYKFTELYKLNSNTKQLKSTADSNNVYNEKRNKQKTSWLHKKKKTTQQLILDTTWGK